MNAWLKRQIVAMEAFSDRPWYPVLIGFLAGLDNLVVVIPTDGILVSSVLLQPRRWLRFAAFVTVGSTCGALILAWLVQQHGLPLIETYYPSLLQTKSWLWTEKLFDEYGLIVVFCVAATPLIQHPAIILAALAGEKLTALALVIVVGRFIKYMAFAWVSAKAPQFLSRIWGLSKELEEVGFDSPAKGEVPKPQTGPELPK